MILAVRFPTLFRKCPTFIFYEQIYRSAIQISCPYKHVTQNGTFPPEALGHAFHPQRSAILRWLLLCGVGGGCPVRCRTFAAPLSSRCQKPPEQGQPKMCPGTANCSLGDKTAPVEEPLPRALRGQGLCFVDACVAGAGPELSAP